MPVPGVEGAVETVRASRNASAELSFAPHPCREWINPFPTILFQCRQNRGMWTIDAHPYKVRRKIQHRIHVTRNVTVLHAPSNRDTRDICIRDCVNAPLKLFEVFAEPDDLDHDDYEGDDGNDGVAAAPAKLGHVAEVHSVPAGEQGKR